MDSVISQSPNSNIAKLLAQNYEKILARISTSMPNPTSCTHIKVSGVRCGSPALRGEQFCYFHQQAHRGVRRPPFARLHPMAILEDPESIQASLMEVINGLVRNTLDVKRAELIIRALHIGAKNARNTNFDSKAYPKVKEVPKYAIPANDNLEWKPTEQDAALDPNAELPAIAAKPPRPIDPQDPHFHERSEEGGRYLARQAVAERAAQARAAAARKPNGASDALARPSREATPSVGAKAFLRPANPSEAKGSVPAAEATAKPKPPVSAKPAPQDRKHAAQRASAG